MVQQMRILSHCAKGADVPWVSWITGHNLQGAASRPRNHIESNRVCIERQRRDWTLIRKDVSAQTMMIWSTGKEKCCRMSLLERVGSFH